MEINLNTADVVLKNEGDYLQITLNTVKAKQSKVPDRGIVLPKHKKRFIKQANADGLTVYEF